MYEEIKTPQKANQPKSSQNNAQESSSKSQEGESQSQEKNNEEKQIAMTNMQPNSILKSNTEDIDWDFMKSQIELINASWSVMMLELYKSNVSNDDIISTSDLINKTIISIKNEDKATTLTNLTNLYSYIPKFVNILSSEKQKFNLENTKYHILATYSFITQDDWNSSIASLTEVENAFLIILNDTEYSKNKEFKINKIYMLIKDLQKAVLHTDKELFFVKYKNLIENLNTL